MTWLAWVILAVSLVVTGGVTWFVAQTVETREASRFDQMVRTAQLAMQQRLDRNVDVLRGARGVVVGRSTVGRMDLAAFADSLDVAHAYPGLEHFGYVERIWADSRDAQIAQFRNQGLPFLRVWPRSDTEEQYPLVLVQPADAPSLAALGYDLAADRTRRAALERAATTGEIAATGPLRPIDKADGVASRFAVFVPLFRDAQPLTTPEQRQTALFGFVYGQFRIDRLLANVVDDDDADFDVLDEDPGEPPLYRSDRDGAARRPRLASEVPIVLPGRTWQLRFVSTAGFDQDTQRWLPIAVAVGGLLVSGLLAAIAWTQAVRRAVAQDREVVAARATLLEEMNRRQREFVSIASHELRTPITSILGFAEMLQIDTPTDHAHRQYVDVLFRQAQELGRLTDDLLDVSRLDAGKVVVTPRDVDLQSEIERVTSAFAPITPKHRFVARVADDAEVVRADPEKLAQILRNLIDNAVKYSPAGGDIVVEAQRVQSQVEIAVSDHGLGIPEDLLERVFERFQRVDPSDGRRVRGTGLGLYIVRRLVELQGGRIWVESTLGQGSTFRFTLLAGETSHEPTPVANVAQLAAL